MKMTMTSAVSADTEAIISDKATLRRSSGAPALAVTVAMRSSQAIETDTPGASRANRLANNLVSTRAESSADKLLHS